MTPQTVLCQCSMLHYIFYITVEDVEVYEPERKKPRLDIDRDSAMGLSVFTSGKSTTLSEVSLLISTTHYAFTYTVLMCSLIGSP